VYFIGSKSGCTNHRISIEKGTIKRNGTAAIGIQMIYQAEERLAVVMHWTNYVKL
jgi:hypothetical protein